MKKTIAALLLAASFLSLAACSVTMSPRPTAASTTAPTPTEPAVTTTAPDPEPPAPELSDSERVALLLSELETVAGLSFAGELRMETPEDGEGGTADDTYIATGLLSAGGLSASGMKNGLLPFSAVLSEMTLTYTEGGATVPYTAAELLSAIPELAVNLGRADRALGSLVHLLSTYGAVVDLWLSERGVAADSADLLCAVDALVLLFQRLAAEVGYEPTVALSGAEGDFRHIVPELVTVSPADAGGYSVVFDLDPLTELLRELLASLSEKIELTVSTLIDLSFGEGTASEVLLRLAMISGSDRLSVLTAELEKIALAASLAMDDLYAIAAALISENLTAGLTAAELKAIVRENRNKSVDQFISRFAPDKTYALLMEWIATLLSKTPAEIYSEQPADGAGAEPPSLAERMAELDAFLARTGETVSLSVSVDSSWDMKPLSISLAFSFLSDALRASLSLSAAPKES